MDLVRMARHGLSREVWTFYVDSNAGGELGRIELRLMRYERQSRPSRRHRTWTTVAWWFRTHARRGAVEVLREPPRLPDDHVRADILQRLDISWREEKRL